MDGWTLRLTAAAVLTLCGAAAGRSLAAVRRRRVVQLMLLTAALQRLEVQMLEKLLPLKEALAASAHPALGAVGEGMTGARGALLSWLGAADALRARGGELSALCGEDVAALDRLFDGLGTSGASEQRILLEGVQEELKRLAQAARKTADEHAKLYTSLGLIAGLALSICLL
ncbi:stage III sporulation protein AB [Bacillota bacterium Meth-B3]|nr:stage III sporulation protein AB [Christensenellaceae bacterium]